MKTAKEIATFDFGINEKGELTVCKAEHVGFGVPSCVYEELPIEDTLEYLQIMRKKLLDFYAMLKD